MTKDNGSWLSAEQAVLPDGTERENLSLINKKLPSLSQTSSCDGKCNGHCGEPKPTSESSVTEK